MKEGDLILCHEDDIGRVSNRMEAQSGHYIINKWKEGQPRVFKCGCCGKNIDLKDSDDYAGAVNQWKTLGKKCYACGHNLGSKTSFPCHVK